MSKKTFIIGEGSITLPSVYQDNSINVYTAEGRAGLNITRETLPPGISFKDYLRAQKNILQQNLPSFTEGGESILSVLPDDVEGVIWRYTYFNNMLVQQSQAIIFFPEGKVFVISMSMPYELKSDNEELLSDVVSQIVSQVYLS